MEFAATVIDVHPKKKDPEDCAQIELKVTTPYNSELITGLAGQLNETVKVTIEPIIKIETQIEIPGT